MRDIEFDVLGSPTPKGSYRAIVLRNTNRAILVPSGSDERKKKLKSWDTALREAAAGALSEASTTPGSPLFCSLPLCVSVTFRLVRPKGHWGKKGLLPSAPARPVVKPDLDKLMRSTCDTLTGIVWSDDSNIVVSVAEKIYADPGREGAFIRVTLAA